MEDRGSKNDEASNRSKKKTPLVIGVPSYKEVIESSQAKSTPPSLFAPSQSFSQAFAFIKNSEFYASPPAADVPTSGISAPRLNAESSKPSPSDSSATSTQCPAAVASSSSFPNSTQNRNAIFVSHRQKGNPLLKHIRNVRWTFADVVCDYLLGQNSCALYLSLRYHLLHPDYLYYRIRELQKNFKLRVVLCHVDVEDVVKPLLEVTKTALLHDCTLLCGWSLEECGRYLETIKVYENKPADLIQGQMDTDYLSRLNHGLTSIRHVNKTDVVTLGSTFGSLSSIMDASMEDLARCPGIGERKVKRLYDTFHEPFKRIVPSHPPVPETPVQQVAEPSSASEMKERENGEETNKRRKKETETSSIRSALSAAFSRYANKMQEKDNESGTKEGETGAVG